MPQFGIFTDTYTTQFIRDDGSQKITSYYKYPSTDFSGSVALTSYKGTSIKADDITWSRQDTLYFPTNGGITSSDTYWIYNDHHIFVGRRATFLLTIRQQRLQSPNIVYALQYACQSLNTTYILPNRVSYTLIQPNPFNLNQSNIDYVTSINRKTIQRLQIATRRYKSLFKHTNDYGGALIDEYLFVNGTSNATPWANSSKFTTTPSAFLSPNTFNKLKPSAVLPAGGTSIPSGSFLPSTACPTPEECITAQAIIIGGIAATVLTGGLAGVWGAAFVGIPAGLLMFTNPSPTALGNDAGNDIYGTQNFDKAFSECCRPNSYTDK